MDALRRVRRWIRGSEGAADGLLALLLAAVLVIARAVEASGHSHGAHAAWLGYVLAVVAGLLVAGRRRWPLAIFASTLTVALVAIGLDNASGAITLPVVVALYTLAQLQPQRRALALAVAAATALAVVRGVLQHKGWSDARTAAEPALVFAALFLGWAVSSHRAYIAEINERAERAERTREHEARRQVDAERLRIARELHDVVAHSIATINVQAGVAGHVLDERPEVAAEALRTIKAASKDALRELRNILGVLRHADEADPRAPAPGLDQLDALVAAICSAGLPTRVIVSGARRPLPPTTDLAAYRIVQESLTNALRHAGDASAVVSITFDRDRLTVAVEDTGSGQSNGHVPDGHGIIGMRERAATLGGELEAGACEHGGFRVRATLPVPESA